MQLPWSTPTAEALAARQLTEAERDLIQAEACEEYYHHHVIMLRERVNRLKVRSGSIPSPVHLIPVGIRKVAA